LLIVANRFYKAASMNTNLPMQSNQPIQLRHDGGQVVITPEDQDRFVRDSGWAVSACQGVFAIEKMLDHFAADFLRRLQAWCEQHRERVSACYVPYPTQEIRVFVISASKSFDFGLSDLISDLEMELASANWKADILQLPSSSPEMLQSFFDPSRSFLVYGNADRTQIESGA
jgi:hypothetical protein